MTDGEKLRHIGWWVGIRVTLLTGAIVAAKAAWFVALRII